jgi:hypothetical protein
MKFSSSLFEIGRRLTLSTLAMVAFVAFTTPQVFAAGPVSLENSLTDSPQAPNESISTTLSQNWSGYVSQNKNQGQDSASYTSVTGTWIVPTVTPSNSVAADATWVGIGGMTGNDLIQAGTQAVTQNGSVQYEAWYETLPNASTAVSLTVNPGDSITTTLTETSTDTWSIEIKDNTTGQQFVTTIQYVSSNSSAEWIQEMPSDQVSFLPLDDFGSVPFTNASTVINNVSENLIQANATALTIVSGSDDTVLSYPSAIGSDGASFTVTRSTNAASVEPHLVRIGRNGFTRGPRGMDSVNPSTSSTASESWQNQSQAMQQLIQQMQQMLNEETSSGSISNLIPIAAPSVSNATTKTFSEGPFTITVITTS